MQFEYFIVGIIVFITHAIEAVTGFGCTVLAFPFVSSIISIYETKVILTIIAWLLALYFVITKFKDINFKEFIIIVLFVSLGMPIGIYFFNNFPSHILKLCLGIFIVITSSIQIYKLYSKNDQFVKLPTIFYYIILFFGGIVHGAFSTGGPFVVLYASKKLEDKGAFRATLCLLWTTLNTILFFTDKTFKPIFNSIFTLNFSPEVKHLLLMFPFLFAGIIAGEYIHNKVNAEVFKKIVFIVLLLTGIFMIISPYIIKAFGKV